MFYLFLFLCISARFGSCTINKYFKRGLIDGIADLRENLDRLDGKNREIAEKLIELGALGIGANWENIVSDFHEYFDNPAVLRNIEIAFGEGKKRLLNAHRLYRFTGKISEKSSVGIIFYQIPF